MIGAMTKRIRIIGRQQPRIINTGPKEPLVDPDVFAAAIGAERVAESELSERWKAIVRSARR
jgi:hypothetical protein